jgi:N-methylhydantoinase A
MNIAAIARELRRAEVVVPRTASALSACGMQFSDVVFEHAAAFVTRTNKFDHGGVNRTLAAIRRALDGFVESLRGRGLQGVTISCSVEARYLFQVWELDVALPMERFDGEVDVARLVESFHAVHERVLGVRDVASPVECLNWRGRVSCRMAEIPPARREALSTAAVVPKGRRRAWFGTAAGEDCPVYRGDDLFAGAAFAGPAIVEEPTTTVVVYPGMNCRVSETGNYVIATNG